jgi:protein-S-isoprenylcysteine O-methyltransferase Ste14
MKTKAVLPPTYLLVALIGMALLHLAVPVASFIPRPWNLLGMLPMAGGIVLNLLADRDFHRAETTVKPFETSSALVTTGVYRITRNPMYLGYVLILLGVGLLLRSLMPLIVIPIFGFLVARVFIRVEEEMLQETFGPTWDAYTRRVRRWI